MCEAPTLPSCPYSPECVEGVFSELRLEGVLRSSPIGDLSIPCGHLWVLKRSFSAQYEAPGLRRRPLLYS